jgi:hypothetical protein
MQHKMASFIHLDMDKGLDVERRWWLMVEPAEAGG